MPEQTSKSQSISVQSRLRHHILIVGCGSIGERHLRCFGKTGRATLTACETNPELLAAMKEKYGAATVSDLDAALESKAYDAVVICTPAHLHIPMALKALKQNIHTLIEKPLSQSMDGVEELLASCRRASCQTAVAYVLHVHRVLVQAREFLRRGELGPIQQATVTAGQPFYKFRPAYAESYYRSRDQGGGAIQDALTHTANWMESVLGPADSLLCDCAHQVLPKVEVEDTVHLNARHGRILSSFSLNQFQAPNENTIQFNAAKGSLKIEMHRQRWGVYRDDSSDWEWHDAAVENADSHFQAQAEAFLDQIEGQPSRLCSVEAAAQTLRFNLAALASAASGQRESCRDTKDT